MNVYFQVPEDAVIVSSGGIGFEFEVADENSLKMEQHIIDVCREENLKNGFEVYSFTARSFNDVSFETIFFDVWKMLGGYVIMFFYTVIMLGRLNRREVRNYLKQKYFLNLIKHSDTTLPGRIWDFGVYSRIRSLAWNSIHVRLRV